MEYKPSYTRCDKDQPKLITSTSEARGITQNIVIQLQNGNPNLAEIPIWTYDFKHIDINVSFTHLLLSFDKIK